MELLEQSQHGPWRSVEERTRCHQNSLPQGRGVIPLENSWDPELCGARAWSLVEVRECWPSLWFLRKGFRVNESWKVVTVIDCEAEWGVYEVLHVGRRPFYARFCSGI